jgi:hypothetical protein
VLGGVHSTGDSLAFERYEFGEQGGRFVRLLGHGNTVNAWNSINEVEVWGEDL